MDFVISFKCGNEMDKTALGYNYCLVSPESLEAMRIDIRRELTLSVPEIVQQDVSLRQVTLEQFR
jgi:hypothetical protein